MHDEILYSNEKVKAILARKTDEIRIDSEYLKDKLSQELFAVCPESIFDEQIADSALTIEKILNTNDFLSIQSII